MRVIGKQGMFGRSAVTMVAAGLLLLQTVIAGLAAGASFSGADSQILRLVCSKGDSGSSQGDRQAPASHHSGACCILHNEAAIEPGLTPGAQLALAPTLVGLSHTPIDAVRAAPELGPRSARAPPPRFA